MRGRLFVVLIAIAALAASTGCQSAGRYLLNRAADLADIVTLELTAGRGADLHGQLTGFLGTAAGYSSQKGFMLHGRFYGTGTRETAGILLFGATATRAVQMSPVAGQRPYEGRYGVWALLLPATSSPAEGFHVGYLPRWPRGADVEFGVSFGLGFHAGLSPGELLDFLLGFSTLDMAGDDLPGEPSSKPERTDMPPVVVWPGLSLRPLWIPR